MLAVATFFLFMHSSYTDTGAARCKTRVLCVDECETPACYDSLRMEFFGLCIMRSGMPCILSNTRGLPNIGVSAAPDPVSLSLSTICHIVLWCGTWDSGSFYSHLFHIHNETRVPHKKKTLVPELTARFSKHSRAFKTRTVHGRAGWRKVVIKVIVTWHKSRAPPKVWVWTGTFRITFLLLQVHTDFWITPVHIMFIILILIKPFLFSGKCRWLRSAGNFC